MKQRVVHLPAEIVMADVEQILAHVPKDLAVPTTDGVEQEQAIAAVDASRVTAPPVTEDVGQNLAHVLKDLAVPHSEFVEQK